MSLDALPQGRRGWRYRYYRRRLTEFIWWLRWGQITERVVDQIENTVCEKEALDCYGRRIGYWGYGSWDPSYPFPGRYYDL